MNRVIIFGRIDYKNKRSVNFARNEYIRHNETKAKGDLIFRPEVFFGEEPDAELDFLHIEFKRKIHEAADKTLQHSLNALEVLMQFAIAGRVDVFVLAAGELPQQRTLTVRNDKSTVHALAAGLEAIEEARYADAIPPLTDAISSYKQHAWALDARSTCHYELGDLEAAEADAKAARAIYPALPNPHLTLARIADQRGERAKAIDGCKRAMDGSIPHQPGYWICALFQAKVLLDLLESGGGSTTERKSYLNVVRSNLDRYDSKLRQLGNARGPHYPTPAELAGLRERYESVAASVRVEA